MKIDPDLFINFVVTSYENLHELPTPEDIGNRIDELLVGPFAALSDQREALLNEALRRLETRTGVATILDNQEGHEEWLPSADRAGWRFWPRLHEYLQTIKRFPRSVLRELDRSTDDTLGRLESPGRLGRWDRRGLVLGHIQSGKTTHYTSLAAKSLDAGYQVVIILAGIHNSLRSQTHERIDHQLLGRDSARFIEAATRSGGPGPRQVGVGERDLILGRQMPPNVITFTSNAENGDFSKTVAQQIGMDLGTGSRLVLVVKKNTRILENLIQWFESQHPRVGGPDSGPARHAIPALVIDDEADHASINTVRDPESDPRRINGLIRRLLGTFDRIGFVGYTATPFANIFIAPDVEHERFGRDLFPEHFIINLKAPSDYVGPAVVFGNPGDESVGILPEEPLPLFVPADDTASWMPDKHRKTHAPGPLPESLKEALRLFILVCAARRCRGEVDVHNSMLVHVTRFVAVQQRVLELVKDETDAISQIVRFGSGALVAAEKQRMQQIWEGRIATCHNAFAGRLPDSCQLPSWGDVWGQVPLVLERAQARPVNGTAADALVYSRHPNGIYVIAIGGDKLSRGLTLEGLSVSYFLRTSKMYDTLMQMGRWFGYRHGYLDLCRVYTPAQLKEAFREISLATEELRNDLDYMADAGMKPRDFGLRVRTPSDGLLITAPDRMRRGEQVAVKFAGELVQTLSFPRSGPDAQRNRDAVRKLVASLDPPARTIRQEESSHFLWAGVPAQKILEFMSAFEAYHTPSFCDRCDGLRRYIRQQSDRGELGSWTVAVISKGRRDDNRAAVVGIHSIPLVDRGPAESPADRFVTQALVGSADEAVDLSLEEYASALARTRECATRNGDTRAVRTARREIVRAVRPPTRGLLLIYLVADPDLQGPEDFMPAIAVSFPDGLSGGSVEYTVNSVWLEQHGLLGDWEEDAGT